VPCPILDWFQQSYDDIATRAHMAGWYNGAFSEIWWCFPKKPAFGGSRRERHLIIYNFRKTGGRSAKIKRHCGAPGTAQLTRSWPAAAISAIHLPAREGPQLSGSSRAALDPLGLLRARQSGITMATTRQLLVDTDADLDAVSYQLFATKGRYSNARERSLGAKVPKPPAGAPGYDRATSTPRARSTIGSRAGTSRSGCR
jgi:hypothetical protein